ncbi:MAG: glucosyltransferase domain-containing protein [Clostridia bacterium]|nr:glucosyltransferase domain-containing protein [Clostridia bacterium]
MGKVSRVITNIYDKNRKSLLFCLLITFVVGLVTHAYMFFQDSFSHDSLNEFNASEFGNEWKIQLGRFIVPVYRMITRGNLTIPWLIGVIALFWVALSVFLTVKMFNIENKLYVFLIAGLYSTNLAVISNTATYINDLDANMFALFLSVLAVFLWDKWKFGFALSIPCIVLTLGIYQSYICVTISLVIISIIFKIITHNYDFKAAFFNGLKSIFALLASGIVYILTFKLVLKATGIQEATNTSNSLDNLGSLTVPDFINTAINVCKTTIYSLFFPKNSVFGNIIGIFIAFTFLIVGIFILSQLFKQKERVLENLLVLFLIIILPFEMSLPEILAGGVGHDLMRFSHIFIYLFALLVIHQIQKSGSTAKKELIKTIPVYLGKSICILTSLVILWSNIVSANEIYLKKDLEQDSALSFFTRVVYQMDNCEDYDRKSTPVVFVGRPDYYDENKNGFKNGYEIMGATGNYVLGAAAPSWYKRYFEYKLHYDIIVIENDELAQYKQNDYVKDMPCFPDEGCMQKIDNVLVVKLGEIN